MPLVVVDAENVRRSLWPNLSAVELVTRARAWAEAEGHDLLIVFDGAPPERALDLDGASGESADDRIAALAAQLEEPFWLVTSDRGLRSRVGERAGRVLGGGGYARLLTGGQSSHAYRKSPRHDAS